MDQKGYIHLYHEKGDETFTFLMPMGAPLADAADAAFCIFKACDKMYREAIDKELEKKEQEAVEIKTDDDK